MNLRGVYFGDSVKLGNLDTAVLEYAAYKKQLLPGKLYGFDLYLDLTGANVSIVLDKEGGIRSVELSSNLLNLTDNTDLMLALSKILAFCGENFISNIFDIITADIDEEFLNKIVLNKEIDEASILGLREKSLFLRGSKGEI